MMNKFGVVLGVAAVATLAGCKDPDYVGKNGRAPQDEVKTVATETVEVNPAVLPIAPAEAPKPEVQPTPVVQPVVEKPAEEAYTMYTVRRGDYLAKISKKYNVTISSIKRLNPQLKGDTVKIGQKIKLPGVIVVEAAPAEPAKAAPTKVSTKIASDYTGATVEYTVKNGDTLGGIAYGHGINIRQLKKINGLTGDSLKIGQKLKVPANGKTVTKTAPAEKTVPTNVEPTSPAPSGVPAPAESTTPAEQPAEQATEPATATADKAEAPVAPAAPAVKTYVVQEGEDMAGISVAWGVTASQIRELNNLGENDQLKPGQTIRLPAEADQQ